MALALALTACAPEGSAPLEPSPWASSDVVPPVSTADDSLWSLVSNDGTTTRLADDDQDVQDIRTRIVLWGNIVDNRDWRTLDESIEQERDYLSSDFQRLLDEQRYTEKLTSLYVNNELAFEAAEVGWFASTIHESRKTAQIEFSSTFTFTHGAPQYLAERGFAIGDRYIEMRKANLEQVNGEWRITGIERLPLKKAPQFDEEERED